eukprot:COSAG01_NODE_15_length_40797_cov_245.690550_10_plen_265_part_00
METMEAQVEKMDTEKTEVDQRIAELTTDAEFVLERLGKGYGAVQQRRKLQSPRDAELLANLKRVHLQASRPEQGVKKLKDGEQPLFPPPAQLTNTRLAQLTNTRPASTPPCSALFAAVVVDMAKCLSFVEGQAIMLEKVREKWVSLLRRRACDSPVDCQRLGPPTAPQSYPFRAGRGRSTGGEPQVAPGAQLQPNAARGQLYAASTERPRRRGLVALLQHRSAAYCHGGGGHGGGGGPAVGARAGVRVSRTGRPTQLTTHPPPN